MRNTLSPFRYPGGKTWFAPILRKWLGSMSTRPKIFVEPFAGGGSMSLLAVSEGWADSALMTEADRDVAAVWKTVLGDDADWLAERIETFKMTLNNALFEINEKPRRTRDLAFRTILRNRVLHGGILAGNTGLMRNGDGKGVASRWYPKTLADRIRAIHKLEDRIVFLCADGFSALEKLGENPDAVFFVDPPYTAGGKNAGKRLYSHNEIDHDKLFEACNNLSGSFLLTYDNNPEVVEKASRHGFEVKPVGMKNAHHAKMDELVISKNLEWLVDI